MSDYAWRDKVDPSFFEGRPEAGFRHYRNEWDRLSRLIRESFDIPTDKDEREEMRRDRNQAAARVIGYSFFLLP